MLMLPLLAASWQVAESSKTHFLKKFNACKGDPEPVSVMMENVIGFIFGFVAVVDNHVCL